MTRGRVLRLCRTILMLTAVGDMILGSYLLGNSHPVAACCAWGTMAIALTAACWISRDPAVARRAQVRVIAGQDIDRQCAEFAAQISAYDASGGKR